MALQRNEPGQRRQVGSRCRTRSHLLLLSVQEAEVRWAERVWVFVYEGEGAKPEADLELLKIKELLWGKKKKLILMRIEADIKSSPSSLSRAGLLNTLILNAHTCAHTLTRHSLHMNSLMSCMLPLCTVVFRFIHYQPYGEHCVLASQLHKTDYYC